VRASQRERLLRSVIAAVSESGYLAVTVAAIVRRARVSRVAFYAHFADKEDRRQREPLQPIEIRFRVVGMTDKRFPGRGTTA
jgi:hypothetical protein